MIPILLALALSQQVTLTYPIPQLDNCRDAKECFFYCEIPRHQNACQQFARSRQLTKVLGISTTPNYTAIAQRYGITYPIKDLNNCADHYSCKSFCSQSKNFKLCTTFAQNHGLID